MIDAWWLAVAASAGIITGVAASLAVAAAIKTQPMDGRTYTGDLGALEEHDDAA